MVQKKPTRLTWRWTKKISLTLTKKTMTATNRNNPNSAPSSKTCTYLNRAWLGENVKITT
jgi:hypothetical protein